MTQLNPVSVVWMQTPEITAGELWEWVAARFEPHPGWEFMVEGHVIRHVPKPLYKSKLPDIKLGHGGQARQ